MRTVNLSQPRVNSKKPFLQAPSPESFGRLSESFARYMGTPKFLIQMSVFIGLWLGWNWLAPHHLRFDPYQFMFLTLLLSLQASYAAPLILLAQNRQDDRDKLAVQDDRRRADLNLSISEFLVRELAEIRVTAGASATRGFIKESLHPLEDVGLRLDRLEESLASLHQLLTPAIDRLAPIIENSSSPA